jgi:hypothetical protein
MVRSRQNVDLNQEQYTSMNVVVITNIAIAIDWNGRLIFDK